MVWGLTEYQYTIHALGAVESSMNYGAVNPNDVITIGLIQWYGGRAANLLNNMKAANPSDWTPIPADLDSDLTAHPANTSFWNNRFVTDEEIRALHTVMTTAGNITVQDTQAQTDIDGDYLPAGAAAGIDKDTNSETMAFFINIYNRNPTSARRIVGNCGPDSDLNRIYAYTINDGTEGSFKSRYTQAKTIIAAHDVTGVGTGVNPPPRTGDGGGGGNGNRPPGNAAYLTRRGSQIILVNKDNTRLLFQKTGMDTWLSNLDDNAGVDPPPPTGTGDPPPVGAIADIIAWEMTQINAFSYSQGPGRLDPVTSGYTDCSGLHYYAYKRFAHLNVGTWTGDQINHGHLITNDPSVAKDGSTVIDGDLIFFRWDSNSPKSFDHVELYAGSGQNLSHGGPGKGPHLFGLNSEVDAALSGAYGDGTPGRIQVRRYL